MKAIRRLIVLAILLLIVSLLSGCRLVLFDPHSPEYWNTDFDRYWQQYGYPDPITVP